MKPRLPVRPFVTLGLVLLVCGSGLAGRAAAQVQYRTVALSGQAAPGTPAGVNYSGFSVPALNDAGQAAYVAGLAGSGVVFANGAAIYAGPLAAPQLVARAGAAAPGTPAGAKYESFSSLFTAPALNDIGQVAYFAKLTGIGVNAFNSEVLYAGPLAAPQIVARTGSPAPGTPAGVGEASFLSAPAFNDVGQAAYRATLIGSGVTFTNDEAIYAGSPAAPQLVARTGDSAPGTPAGVTYRLFPSAPVINDAGRAAYFALLTGGGVTAANDSAIYAGPFAAPQLVARKGDAAPGTPAGVNYSSLDAPVINDASQVAYYAYLTGNGVTSANDDVIYAGPFAAPQLVARQGDRASGMPTGVNYDSFSSVRPILNDAGLVTYIASLNGSGVTSANRLAIYAGPFAAPQLVARTGDAAPGTPVGVNYSILLRRKAQDFSVR